MATKGITGLVLRSGTWHIDKQIKGYGRLCESTGTSSKEEAERFLIHRLEGLRKSIVYGERQGWIWREAATKYLIDFVDQPSISLTALIFSQLDSFIGDLPLNRIHDGTLGEFIAARKKEVGNRTINMAIEKVIRVLNLAARKWRDEQGLTWLESSPMITKLDEKIDKRQAYPLNFDEQRYLLQELPAHLEKMALFKMNTGTREQEVTKLRWEWEINIPELEASVFVIPWNFGGRSTARGVKNGEDRVVILNDVAKSVIESMRGINDVYVFSYKGGCLNRMSDHAWRKARVRAAEKMALETGRSVSEGFSNVRVHDLKHTFGRRLRAAGVSHEDRQVLLGHTNGNVTTHYSAAEIDQLIKAANTVTDLMSRKSPALTLIRSTAKRKIA
ncbi:tyrosine-type recombinase/integrase [Iodobacter sp. CM08]|uniref:tyrosine-type recombinase/integrase n=1 Tax=Iodobacter sp. CM08 TaxID=3085902 RepID=UPI0029824D5F|nr:tyrosine-type recombinase/integrase [Iodobacter sp. CM08]MDW5416802.1 tyrosine-type recombinase/integrase [Iodobacter sp. CM08]